MRRNNPWSFAVLIIALLLLSGLLVQGRIAAAPLAAGDLDPGFDGDGVLLSDYSAANDGSQSDNLSTAAAVAIQPDGKIVVVGTAVGPRAFVMRLNPDGSRDTSFSEDGVVLSTPQSHALDVALQADGKIVFAGDDYNFKDILLERYLPDGSPDSSFGDNGRVTTNIGAANSQEDATSIAVLADGRIVIGGESTTRNDQFHTNFDFVLVRYNADGSLDTSFDGDGVALAALSAGRDSILDIAATADGKIVAAGYSTVDVSQSTTCLALARFNLDGSLDSSFSGDGTLTGCSNQAQSLALQPDGKIVVAGYSPAGFAVGRYTGAGEPDSSFGNAGWAATTFEGGSASTAAVALQADGLIVAGGTFVNGPVQGFALARWQANGSLDTGFGNAGKVLTTQPGPRSKLADIAIQADGKILAAGVGGFVDPPQPLYEVALARYLIDGPPATPTATVTPIPATPTSGPGCLLSDVCPGDYWFTPVQALMQRNAISGYADNTFRPFNNATRSQLAKIVVSAFGIPINTNGGPHFIDAQFSNPFYDYIETAVNAGIISGYADSTFKPFNNVTRGQLSKIVSVAAGWEPGNPATPTFGDVPHDNTFFGYIEAAYAHGIISGYADGTFKPYNNATRAQIAKIVYGALPPAAK